MNTATALQTSLLERLQAEDIKPLIGSRIHLSKQELLSGRHAADIRQLLELRGVVVFPTVHFTDEEQAAFTETLGTFLPEIQGQKVYNISLDIKQNPNRDYLKGSLYWHIDGTMNKRPIGAAILSSKVLPSWGGNTEFCNTYASYEALDDAKKAELDNLRVVHSMWNTLLYHTPEPTLASLEQWGAMGEVELPLVWKHRSGRKSLVLGNTAQEVVGKSRFDSAKILHGLREWATQSQFVYSHEWSVGDAVMWDNTGTMHRAMPYDPDSGRLLRRTKTEGEEPIE